jgi:hypothetical protein
VHKLKARLSPGAGFLRLVCFVKKPGDAGLFCFDWQVLAQGFLMCRLSVNSYIRFLRLLVDFSRRNN